jgi:hypothetical protein
VGSPRPPPLVYRVRALPEKLEEDFQIADVQRCRKRALELCAHDLTMFCVLDRIVERTEPVLGDLCIVTALQALCEPAVLHGARVDAQGPGRVPAAPSMGSSPGKTCPTHLRRQVGTKKTYSLALRTRWRPPGRAAPRAKLAANSLIGLLSVDETRSYKLRSSRRDCDAPMGALKQVFHYADGETVYDFITSDSLLSNVSCRPLHDLALCSEPTRVGQMLYCIRQSKPIPYELKTASCMFRPQKCRKVDLALRHCDLHELRDRHEPVENMKRLNEWCSITPNTSQETVFRCSTAVDKDRLHANPGLPSRQAERPETGRAWCDLGEAEAEGGEGDARRVPSRHGDCRHRQDDVCAGHRGAAEALREAGRCDKQNPHSESPMATTGCASTSYMVRRPATTCGLTRQARWTCAS